jgi:hypothetical protein
MKILNPNLLNLPITFDEFKSELPVEDKVQIVLAYIVGINTDNDDFVPVKVNSDGNLLSSNIDDNPTSVAVDEYTLTGDGHVIASANSNRKGILLQNTSDMNIYLDTVSNINPAQSMYLTVGEKLFIPHYTGIIRAGIENGVATLAVWEYS